MCVSLPCTFNTHTHTYTHDGNDNNDDEMGTIDISRFIDKKMTN